MICLSDRVMDDYTMKLKGFLNPEQLQPNLIVASVFIAVYENLKFSIVDNLRYFYFSGFDDGKKLFDNYEKQVLSKVVSKENRQMKATLLWLVEAGAIAEKDREKFKELTNMRNLLSHDMTKMLFEGFPNNIYELYIDMIELFEKITKWWIAEIELPTNPDITSKQYDSIDLDGVTSVNLEFIRIMTDIALTGTDKYLKMLDKEG